MRIAVFGGSFDPVHREHVRLAEVAIKALALDKLLVMPAFAPPHKKGKILSPDEDRLAMCRLAFAHLEQVEVSDYEIQKKGVSYTYLTVADLKEKHPDDELFWLVGTDMLRDFPTWRNPEKILDCATLAVCGRNENGDWVEKEQAEFTRIFGKSFVYLPYNGKDVSSTKIRVWTGAGLRINEFVPDSVEEYILEKGLYAIPYAKEALSLEKPSRQAHSLRVAYLAAKRAVSLGIPERRAIEAALFHDCAKSVPLDSPELAGFTPPTEWGEIPPEVLHQFAGAYLAKTRFGVRDEEVLNAIAYHTSGRENMGELEKLVFLADMLEVERNYEGVEELRALFWQGNTLDGCLKKALHETVLFLRKKGGGIYPLTLQACEYYAKK